jgi:ankyrin repeat protein
MTDIIIEIMVEVLAILAIATKEIKLERGAGVGTPDFSGQTPLHWVVANGDILAMQLLMEYGADVNARDEEGETPSEFGSRFGQHEIVKLLPEFGAKSVE